MWYHVTVNLAVVDFDANLMSIADARDFGRSLLDYERKKNEDLRA